jgi:MFS family permease
MTISTERPPVATIVALGLTQIIGYGSLYYSFSILAPDMARDLNWSSEWIFAALSIALLIGGLAAPLMGTWIDRFGAGRIMTSGSAIAAAALVVCAFAPGKVAFVAALIGIEIASNLVQYGAAFALLVQIRPRVAQRSITYLTLIAGFASTIFLADHHGAARASLMAERLSDLRRAQSRCLPSHSCLALPWRQPNQGTDRRGGCKTRRAEPSAVGAQAGLYPVGDGLCFGKLRELGASGSHGACDVGPRPRRHGSGGRNALRPVTGAEPPHQHGLWRELVASDARDHLRHPAADSPCHPHRHRTLGAPGALVFAVVFGLGSGLNSIVYGTLPLALFGSDGYGRRQGQIMSVRLVVSSMAPFALAFLMGNLGVSWSLSIAALLSTVAVAAFFAIMRLTRPVVAWPETVLNPREA